MTHSVLLLTTYPVVKPRHGGQLRACALLDGYRAGGFEVAHLAVVDKGAFPRAALGPLDIEFPVDDPRWFFEGKDTPAIHDLRAGAFVAEFEEVYQRALSSIPERIDVFHLEQPWLLPLVRRLKAEARYAKSRIVYGSQNLEAPLKDAIFRQRQLPHRERVVERVHTLERAACTEADLTLAVSRSDLAGLEVLGARSVLLAPNGIQPWESSPWLVNRWAAQLRARSVALFVGSAHPPNVDGFIRALGDSLGCVPPDCRIVVAGRVGHELADHYHRPGLDSLNRSRLEITGELDEEELAALKTLADVFLLPIFEGGGSNIKTAEALYSGKPIIATSTSMRGYEAYLGLPELVIADERDDFRQAVRTALSPGARPGPATTNEPLRRQLLWQDCLRPVAAAVRGMLS